ncbi:hypothetical protein [Methylocystis parvus]|nr:hypothetical protein [Methylocystis parvus]
MRRPTPHFAANAVVIETLLGRKTRVEDRGDGAWRVEVSANKAG